MGGRHRELHLWGLVVWWHRNTWESLRKYLLWMSSVMAYWRDLRKQFKCCLQMQERWIQFLWAKIFSNHKSIVWICRLGHSLDKHVCCWVTSSIRCRQFAILSGSPVLSDRLAICDFREYSWGPNHPMSGDHSHILAIWPNIAASRRRVCKLWAWCL